MKWYDWLVIVGAGLLLFGVRLWRLLFGYRCPACRQARLRNVGMLHETHSGMRILWACSHCGSQFVQRGWKGLERNVDPTPAFFTDDQRGEFAGDILRALADLFPPAIGSRLSSRTPILTRWRLMVRTLRHGRTGYFIWTEPSVLSTLKDVLEEVYRGYPRDRHYPDIYNEEHRAGLPMVCLGPWEDGRITIWLVVRRVEPPPAARPRP